MGMADCGRRDTFTPIAWWPVLRHYSLLSRTSLFQVARRLLILILAASAQSRAGEWTPNSRALHLPAIAESRQGGTFTWTAYNIKPRSRPSRLGLCLLVRSSYLLMPSD